MPLLSERAVAIDCPADVAYRYVADLARFGEWFPGVIAIASADALAPGTPGKQYLETVAIPLRVTRQVRLTVREAEPGRRLVTEGDFAPLWPRMEIGFEATGATSCRVTWRMLGRNDGAPARWLLLPLARRVVDRRAVRGMAALKAVLEHAGASAPQ